MDRFACYDCILKNVNYNGVYHCKNCESDHKFSFSQRNFEKCQTIEDQEIPKEKFLDNEEIKKKTEELLNLSSGALENLKGIFKFYQNIY